jgi:LysM repeat protein
MDDNGDNMLGSDTLLAVLPPEIPAATPIEDKVTAVDGSNAVKEPVKCIPILTKQTTYVVKSGDVLGKIARKFEVDMEDILKWNKMKKSVVKKGQKLIINLPEKSVE